MCWKKVFIILVALMGKYGDCATLCGDTSFGENNPSSKDDSIDSNTDFGYMMSDTDYIVGCCGIVDRWEAEFDNVVGSRTIYFQVWRPTTGNTFELIGQNSKTVTTNGEQGEDIVQTDRITVKSGDRWGWWSSGTDIVTYKDEKGGEDDNWMMSLTSLTSGDTQNWGSATVENGRSYGIRMDVLPNNNPEFTNLPETVTFPATSASGTSIYDVSVNDIDTYDVATLTLSMTANADYSFDTSTYEVTTATTFTTSTVDYLRFIVIDQCDNSVTATLTVSITNQPPVINNLPTSASIGEEETVETLLHTINVTDPEGGTVTCSLASSVPASYPFSVRQVSTDYSIYSDTNPGFNFSETTSYTFTIDCTDGEFTDSEDFSVFIIQNPPPVFINLQNFTSVSTTDAIGTNAFTVLVNDTDDLNFSMTCSPSNCPFEIFHSGQILISEDLSNHTTVGYDLYITVSDGRNTVGPSVLTITLADINDPVSIINLPLTITAFENTAVGTSIYTVSFSDLDSSQTHTFSMTSSPTSGLSYFSIHTSTGEITTVGALDYETLVTISTTFVFDVTVADPVATDTESLTIEIINQNEAPSFGQSSYTISTTEGTAGTILGTPAFGITDPDSGDTATLTNDCGSETGYFLMDISSGQVSYQSDYDLDIGYLPTTVSCTVNVTDNGGLTDTASLTIYIADVNDNTPIFSPASYTFFVAYYATAGTSVGTVTATDADSGTYGIITYTLDQSTLAVEHFTISTSGEITIKTTPEGSAMGYATSVTLKAMASDVGALSDNATVIIFISDTTTTSTTTTTDRYRTFLEDPRNIAWLIACIILLLVCLGVLIYVIATCHGQNGCGQFCRTLCNRKKKKFRRRISSGRKDSFDSFPNERTQNWRGRHAITPTIVSARRPPPPIELQSWRTT